MAARKTPQLPTTKGYAWGSERVRLGLSMRDLAELSGVNKGTLSLIEAGRLVPTADQYRDVMDALRKHETFVFVADTLRGTAK